MRWTTAAAAVTAVALALAAAWSRVDDSLLYASLGASALGFALLWRAARESALFTVALGSLLTLPWAYVLHLLTNAQ